MTAKAQLELVGARFVTRSRVQTEDLTTAGTKRTRKVVLYDLAVWPLLTLMNLGLLGVLSLFFAEKGGGSAQGGAELIAEMFGSDRIDRFDIGPTYGFLGVVATLIVSVAVRSDFTQHWHDLPHRVQRTLSGILVIGVLGTGWLSAGVLLNVLIGKVAIFQALIALFAAWAVCVMGRLVVGEPTADEERDYALDIWQRTRDYLERQKIDIDAELPREALVRNEFKFWVLPLLFVFLVSAMGILSDLVIIESSHVYRGATAIVMGGIALLTMQVGWRGGSFFAADGIAARVFFSVFLVYGWGLFFVALSSAYLLGLRFGTVFLAISMVFCFAPLSIFPSKTKRPVLLALHRVATVRRFRKARENLNHLGVEVDTLPRPSALRGITRRLWQTIRKTGRSIVS